MYIKSSGMSTDWTELHSTILIMFQKEPVQFDDLHAIHVMVAELLEEVRFSYGSCSVAAIPIPPIESWVVAFLFDHFCHSDRKFIAD